VVSVLLISDPVSFYQKIDKIRAVKSKMRRIKLLSKQRDDLVCKLQSYKQMINYNKRREEAKVQQQVLTQSLTIDTRNNRDGKSLSSTRPQVSPLKKLSGNPQCFDDGLSMCSQPELRQKTNISMLETAPTVHMSSTCSVSSLETRDLMKIHLPFVVFKPSNCIATLEFHNEDESPETKFSFLGKRSLQIIASAPQELIHDYQLMTQIL
jgi:hypothetical protein